MRDVFVTPQFKKEIKRVPREVLIGVHDLIAILKKNPTDPTLRIKKLAQIDPSAWRLRIGSYRLVFRYDQTTLTLLHIAHRKEVYRRLL